MEPSVVLDLSSTCAWAKRKGEVCHKSVSQPVSQKSIQSYHFALSYHTHRLDEPRAEADQVRLRGVPQVGAVGGQHGPQHLDLLAEGGGCGGQRQHARRPARGRGRNSGGQVGAVVQDELVVVGGGAAQEVDLWVCGWCLVCVIYRALY